MTLAEKVCLCVSVSVISTLVRGVVYTIIAWIQNSVLLSSAYTHCTAILIVLSMLLVTHAY